MQMLAWSVFGTYVAAALLMPVLIEWSSDFVKARDRSQRDD